MKYLLTGGGTGGHVYPALAIANENSADAGRRPIPLRGPSRQAGCLGRARAGIPHPLCACPSLPAHAFPCAPVAIAIALAVGVVQAALILLRYRPQIIISTGGFVSAPILFAHGAMAKVGLSRARVFLYEPNAYPGF